MATKGKKAGSGLYHPIGIKGLDERANELLPVVRLSTNAHFFTKKKEAKKKVYNNSSFFKKKRQKQI